MLKFYKLEGIILLLMAYCPSSVADLVQVGGGGGHVRGAGGHRNGGPPPPPLLDIIYLAIQSFCCHNHTNPFLQPPASLYLLLGVHLDDDTWFHDPFFHWFNTIH